MDVTKLHELSTDLATLLAQQRQILGDLVNLQVHSATTATLFKRDAVMSHLNNKVSAKNVALLRSTSLLGPTFFDQSIVRKANKDLKVAVAHSQGVDSTKAMVSLASTAQQFMQKQGTAPAAKRRSRKRNQGQGSADPKRQKFAQPQQQQTFPTQQQPKQGQSTSRRRGGRSRAAGRGKSSAGKQHS